MKLFSISKPNPHIEPPKGEWKAVNPCSCGSLNYTPNDFILGFICDDCGAMYSGQCKNPKCVWETN